MPSLSSATGQKKLFFLEECSCCQFEHVLWQNKQVMVGMIVYSFFCLNINLLIVGTHTLYHFLSIPCPLTNASSPSMVLLNFLSCVLIGYILVTPSLWIEGEDIQPSDNEIQSLFNMSKSGRRSWGKGQ